MVGGGWLFVLMAGEGIRKEKKRKKFFFLWFSWMGGGSCFLPLSKLLGPGSCFLSSLFGPDQKRPETGWLPLLACLVCFFRWRRSSPTFQVPQRVKFLPLPTGTVLTSTWPNRSRVRMSEEFPPWLQVCWSGNKKWPCRPIELRFPFPAYSMIFFNVETVSSFASSSSPRASDWRITNRFELIALKNMRNQLDHTDEQLSIEDDSSRCPMKADGLIAALVWVLRQLGVEV